jgi:cysteine desulfurase / selenocysteine lyase
MIYLDNAATSFPKPEAVYAAMDRFARTTLANPGRAGHKMALASEHALSDARHRVNRFVNGKHPERVIFTLNGTDALNIAFKGLLGTGDHVITSDLEHNSVSRPLVSLEHRGVITLTRIAADAGGTLDPATIEQSITPKTKLVAVTHASNVLGTVQPISDIGAICKKHGVTFLVDAAQTAGVIPLDVQAQHIDLLAFPGHKSLFGPTGIGCLVVSPNTQLRPWREGGTGGDSSTPTQPTDYPHWLEGGTPNVLGIVGLVAGLDYVENETPETIRQHEVELCERLRDQLNEIGGFDFYGHADVARRVGALSFKSDLLPAPELGSLLDQAFDIAIRPGLHCAPYVHRGQGVFPEGLVRVSPGPFNTAGHIDALADALRQIHSGL